MSSWTRQQHTDERAESLILELQLIVEREHRGSVPQFFYLYTGSAPVYATVVHLPTDGLGQGGDDDELDSSIVQTVTTQTQGHCVSPKWLPIPYIVHFFCPEPQGYSRAND